MYRKIAGFAKDTLIYGMGSFAVTAVAVFLLPVYARYLTQAEYGAYSVLRVVMVVLNILFDLGVSSTLVRFYFDDQSDEDRRRLLGTAWLFIQVVALTMTAGLAVSAGFWSHLLVGPSGKAIYWQIVVMQAFFATGLNLPQVIYRARRQPSRFAVLSFANAAVMVAATAYFVVWRHMGLVGALLGMLAAAVIFYVVGMVITLPNIRVSVWWSKLKEVLAFALPLIPHSLAAWVLNFADRLLLRKFGSLAEVGVYSYGYTIGMAMSLVVLATQKSWPQFVFSSHAEMEEGKAKALFSRTASYYMIFLAFAALTLAVYSPQVLLVLAGGKYAAAGKVIPMISMAYLFLGLYTVVGVGVGIKKKSRYYFIATGSGAVANVAMNLVLIPRFGMVGAAISTVAAYVVMSGAIYVVSQRLYHVAYEQLRIALTFVIALVVFILSTFVHASFGVSVALKLGLLALYVVALIATGVIKRTEIAKVRQLVFKGA